MHLATTKPAQPYVIEEVVLDRRLRRPGDIVRALFAIATIVAVGLLAYVAHRTTSGIDQDITQGANQLPAALRFIASLVSAVSVILFPSVACVELLVRGRGRQLAEALAALLVTATILTVASWAIFRLGSDRLLASFAGTTNIKLANPFNVLLGGFTAFITVARLMSRPRINVFSVVILSCIGLASIVAGGITASGLGVSILCGWAVGLLFRYILGTDTTRPASRDILNMLVTLGFRIKALTASEGMDTGRRYYATTHEGQRLDIVVLDRDLEGAGLLGSFYRSLRLRDDPGAIGSSMRAQLDRIALNSWAISTAGIRTPHLLAAAEVGPDAAILVFEHITGLCFDDIDHPLGDAELVGAWEIVRDLQAARIAHRALSAENLMLGADGQVYVTGLADGAIAASDVLMRIDVAELLITLSHVSDPERAIAAGRTVMGNTGLTRALPALQNVALSNATRQVVKQNKELLSDMRTRLLTFVPDGARLERIDIERIKPRTLLTIALGTIAAYILLTQLGRVNMVELLRSSRPGWLVVALGFSTLTYVAATMTLVGVVPEKISFIKTFFTQWAASFATLVAPPTLGSVAINVRFLSKQKLSSALAGASVAVAQVMAFLSHTTLFLIVAIAAGTSKDFGFKPSRSVVLIVVFAALVISVLLMIPKIRNMAIHRVKPFIGQVVPRLTSLANQPAKLATGISGVMLMNIAYCSCLIASVRAFTDSGTIAGIALVYLAGSVVGQAAPTPGGLGAVEAAIAAGLTTTGIDGDIAVSATLVFRLVTFWIPVLPGWIAFQRLQKSGDL